MNMEELLAAGTELLLQSDIAEAKTDAWILMEHHFHLNQVSFWLNNKNTVEEAEKEGYLKLIKKRCTHIPLQYITGEQEFMGFPFKVTPAVLIPRQDTEILAEEALKYCENAEVLDMCTGSGCIIISLAKLSKLKKAVGVDISSDALLVARENGQKNQVQIEWKESDLFETVSGKYDIIISNPPYIKSKDLEELMPEVGRHEPGIALDGMEDGLYFYRKIVEKVKDHLREKGRILFEIGYDQGVSVTEILLNAGFFEIEVIKDLCGLDRVVTGRSY